jgi:nitrile hydratase
MTEVHSDHDHPHAPQDAGMGYYDIMETAVRELLIAKGYFGADEIRRQIEVLDSRSPALGARVVARAWTDPEFRRRLLANGRKACEERLAALVTRDTMIGVVPVRLGSMS